MRSILLPVAALAAATSLSACVSNQPANVYVPHQAGRAMPVQYGVVTDVRMVEIRNMGNSDTTIGALAGGIAGSLLGNEIGAGKGRALATGAGAIAGAAAGSNLARTASRIPAQEWTIRLDNGSTIAVVQNDTHLSIGQHVKIVHDNGRVRILP